MKRERKHNSALENIYLTQKNEATKKERNKKDMKHIENSKIADAYWTIPIITLNVNKYSKSRNCQTVKNLRIPKITFRLSTLGDALY